VGNSPVQILEMETNLEPELCACKAPEGKESGCQGREKTGGEVCGGGRIFDFTLQEEFNNRRGGAGLSGNFRGKSGDRTIKRFGRAE